MAPIGEETSERYEFVPATAYVEVTARIKYACRDCAEGVVIAPAPPAAIEKGSAGPGLVAHVITSKYADHLPLYRQEDIFARQGLEFSRTTLRDWTSQAADRLEPIARAIYASILSSRVVQSDDTPVTVLGGESGSETGHLWVYVGEHGEVAFDFTMSRSRDGPLAFLDGYRGFVQADAYSGYDALFRREGVVEVGCWAHARRYFVEALTSDPRAAHVLALLQRLYAVERSVAEASEEDRLLARQEHARPLLHAIRSKIDNLEGGTLPKGPLGKGVTYARRNWEALQRYSEHGFLRIDNNDAERAIRAVALGRKNWLFAGSEGAGHRAAVLMTLIGTCKLQGVEPFRYLRDVLIRRWTTPQSRIYDLTPRGWKQAVAEGRIVPQA
jgi:transposase